MMALQQDDLFFICLSFSSFADINLFWHDLQTGKVLKRFGSLFCKNNILTPNKFMRFMFNQPFSKTSRFHFMELEYLLVEMQGHL
jgi:hypothetical protein